MIPSTATTKMAQITGSAGSAGEPGGSTGAGLAGGVPTTAAPSSGPHCGLLVLSLDSTPLARPALGGRLALDQLYYEYESAESEYAVNIVAQRGVR